MADSPHPADRTRPSRWPRWTIIAALAAFVLWQATSCCRAWGAEAPPMTPFPVSKELAQEVRERVTETKSRKGAFTIAVSDQELTSYVVSWLQSGPGEFPAKDMQIQFGDGYVEIWATFIDIAPSDIPVYIKATVDAVEGQAVFHIAKAMASSILIPGAMRSMSDRL